MPKFRETPFQEIIEGCANQSGLTPAEVEELAAAHCRIARAGTFVRNDPWSGMNEKPEPADYSHFEAPPYYYVPDSEDLKSALERLEREAKGPA